MVVDSNAHLQSSETVMEIEEDAKVTPPQNLESIDALGPYHMKAENSDYLDHGIKGIKDGIEEDACIDDVLA